MRTLNFIEQNTISGGATKTEVFRDTHSTIRIACIEGGAIIGGVCGLAGGPIGAVAGVAVGYIGGAIYGAVLAPVLSLPIALIYGE
ncbi:MAG TPA: hypothetical protein VFP93_04995 [Gammaproteobacteria bacterium]|nr:hypothetical protein [Gammaproteobacteria bacterium]